MPRQLHILTYRRKETYLGESHVGLSAPIVIRAVAGNNPIYQRENAVLHRVCPQAVGTILGSKGKVIFLERKRYKTDS